MPIAGISTRILQRIERGANASRNRLKHIASVLENDFENLGIAQEMPTAEQLNFPRLSAEKKRRQGICKWLKAFFIPLFVAAAVVTALTIITLSLSLNNF